MSEESTDTLSEEEERYRNTVAMVRTLQDDEKVALLDAIFREQYDAFSLDTIHPDVSLSRSQLEAVIEDFVDLGWVETRTGESGERQYVVNSDTDAICALREFQKEIH